MSWQDLAFDKCRGRAWRPWSLGVAGRWSLILPRITGAQYVLRSRALRELLVVAEEAKEAANRMVDSQTPLKPIHCSFVEGFNIPWPCIFGMVTDFDTVIKLYDLNLTVTLNFGSLTATCHYANSSNRWDHKGQKVKN